MNEKRRIRELQFPKRLYDRKSFVALSHLLCQGCVLSKVPENCPVCGEKMEKGYIVWGSNSIRWSKKKRRMVLGAEPLITRPIPLYSAQNAEAYRCPNCTIVLFSYGEEKKEE